MGGARVILCTAPNGKAMGELVGGLAPDGQMVIVAASRDPMVGPPPFLLLPATLDQRVGRGKSREKRSASVFMPESAR